MIPEFPIYIRAYHANDAHRYGCVNCCRGGATLRATTDAFLLLPRMTQRNTSFAPAPRARVYVLPRGASSSERRFARATAVRTNVLCERRTGDAESASVPDCVAVATTTGDEHEAAIHKAATERRRRSPGAGVKRTDPMHSLRIN